jgi:hypothetical protein
MSNFFFKRKYLKGEEEKQINLKNELPRDRVLMIDKNEIITHLIYCLHD